MAMSVGSRTKAWILPIAVGILAFIALAFAIGGLALYLLLGRSGPTEHHNASFRFGQRVLDDIYGTLSGSVDGACRVAVAAAPHKPTDFDLDEAIAGCKYEENSFDD